MGFRIWKSTATTTPLPTSTFSTDYRLQNYTANPNPHINLYLCKSCGNNNLNSTAI